jgi:hypothetical protein
MDIWHLLLDLTGDTSDRTTSPCADDQIVKLAVTGLNNFLRGLIVVSKWVAWVGILVQHMRAIDL